MVGLETLKAQTTARPSPDRQSLEDVAPMESDGVGDLNVWQVTPPHPLLDAAGRFLEPGSQFAFGEKFFPGARSDRGGQGCSTMAALGR